MSAIYDSQAVAFTENGNSTVELVQGEDYAIGVAGTFDSASLTFDFIDGAGNAVPVPEAGSTDGASPLTVTAAAIFEISALCAALKITVASAGESAAVTVTIARIHAAP